MSLRYCLAWNWTRSRLNRLNISIFSLFKICLNFLPYFHVHVLNVYIFYRCKAWGNLRWSSNPQNRLIYEHNKNEMLLNKRGLNWELCFLTIIGVCYNYSYEMGHKSQSFVEEDGNTERSIWVIWEICSEFFTTKFYLHEHFND